MRSCHKPNFSVNLLGLLCPSASGAEDSKNFIGTTSIFRQFYEQNAFADAATRRMSKFLLSTRLLSKKRQRACKRSLLQVSRRHENLSIAIFICLQHLFTVGPGVTNHWMTGRVRGVVVSETEIVGERWNAFLYF